MGNLRQLLWLVPLAACFVLTGCPDEDPPVPIPDQDAGTTPSADAGPAGVDAGPKTFEPTQALTTGGGTGSNNNYKVRLIIGGPTGNGTGSNTNQKVKLGAGAAQHGQ